MVLIVKLALIEPAGTVTVAGTDALMLFEERFTMVSEAWDALSVTVPVAEFPP